MNALVSTKGKVITINGVTYKGKFGIVNAILTLLKLHGYTFDFILRPFPCILNNWRDVDMRVLFKMFLRIYNFLSSDESCVTFQKYKDFLLVTPHGFDFCDSEHKTHTLYSVRAELNSHTFHSFVLAERLPIIMDYLRQHGATLILVS